jgi:hypothetical protein
MSDISRDQLFELAQQRGGLFGRNVEAEDFDCNEAVAGRIVRAEDGTERACADLMENPKRPECLWRKVQD